MDKQNGSTKKSKHISAFSAPTHQTPGFRLYQTLNMRITLRYTRRLKLLPSMRYMVTTHAPFPQQRSPQFFPPYHNDWPILHPYGKKPLPPMNLPDNTCRGISNTSSLHSRKTTRSGWKQQTFTSQIDLANSHLKGRDHLQSKKSYHCSLTN